MLLISRYESQKYFWSKRTENYTFFCVLHILLIHETNKKKYMKNEIVVENRLQNELYILKAYPLMPTASKYYMIVFHYTINSCRNFSTKKSISQQPSEIQNISPSENIQES